MEGGWEIETQLHEFGKLEEIFEDRDGDIFYTIISFGLFHELKIKFQSKNIVVCVHVLLCNGAWLQQVSVVANNYKHDRMQTIWKTNN